MSNKSENDCRETNLGPPNKGGRPTKYTPELAETIARRFACGEGIPTIAADPAMPCRSTIAAWEDEDREGFALIMARARVYAAEERAHRPEKRYKDAEAFLLEKRIVKVDGKDVEVYVNDVQRAGKLGQLAKEQDGYDRWLAGRQDPERWGDRQQLDINAPVLVGTAFTSCLPLPVIEAIEREDDADRRAEAERLALPTGEDS